MTSLGQFVWVQECSPHFTLLGGSPVLAPVVSGAVIATVSAGAFLTLALSQGVGAFTGRARRRRRVRRALSATAALALALVLATAAALFWS